MNAERVCAAITVALGVAAAVGRSFEGAVACSCCVSLGFAAVTISVRGGRDHEGDEGDEESHIKIGGGKVMNVQDSS